jgi:hypothetical protein
MTNNSLVKVSLKWGLIYAGINALLFVLFYALRIDANMIASSIMMFLAFTINILIFVFSNRDFRKTYLGGYIGYWKCVFNSVFVVLISYLFSCAFLYILYQVVDYDSFSSLVDDLILFIDNNENIPIETKQKTINNYMEMTPFTYSFGIFISGISRGLILSLIISAFTRKKNNTFEGAIKEIE